jgi:hypothetical protein
MSNIDSINQEDVKKRFDYKDGFLIYKQSFAKAKAGKIVGINQKQTNYTRVCFNNKIYMAHRIIFLWHHGFLPEEVDHIDRNIKNNKIENLRAATRLENAKNRKKNITNTSGFTGVYWQKNAGKWRAMIQVNKRLVCFGLFAKIEDAVEARQKAAEKIYGSFLPL